MSYDLLCFFFNGKGGGFEVSAVGLSSDAVCVKA